MVRKKNADTEKSNQECKAVIMILFGKGDFEDIIKNLRMRTSWIMQVGPKFNVLISDKQGKDRLWQRPCKNRGRASYEAKMSVATKSNEQNLPQSFLEGMWHCRHLEFGLLYSSTAKEYICRFKPPNFMRICYGSPRKLM